MLPNYEMTDHGVLKQSIVKPIAYDPQYVKDRYDKYGVQCDMMSHLRLGYLIGTLNRKPASVLDVGYGNGSFLKVCKEASITTFGTDVSGYELKHGKELTMAECLDRSFEVVSFFDSLEHFEDLSFLGDLCAQYLYISVPNCDYQGVLVSKGEEAADAYFEGWKHRRPDEHLWHFNLWSLSGMLDSFGYSPLAHSYIEDIIRKPTAPGHNILTAVFELRDAYDGN